MLKRLFLILMVVLMGCSNNSVETIENEGDLVAKKKISLEQISLSTVRIDEDEGLEQEETVEPQKESDEPVEPYFWEKYDEEEIMQAYTKGEIEVDLKTDSEPFEDAMLKSLRSDDGRKWAEYITVFTGSSINEISSDYQREMYQVFHFLVGSVNQESDIEKAIEHIENAKEIRESSE